MSVGQWQDLVLIQAPAQPLQLILFKRLEKHQTLTNVNTRYNTIKDIDNTIKVFF